MPVLRVSIVSVERTTVLGICIALMEASCSIPCNRLHKVNHEPEIEHVRPSMHATSNHVQQSADPEGNVIAQSGEMTSLNAIETLPAYLQLLKEYPSLKLYLRPIYEATQQTHSPYSDEPPRKDWSQERLDAKALNLLKQAKSRGDIEGDALTAFVELVNQLVPNSFRPRSGGA